MRARKWMVLLGITLLLFSSVRPVTAQDSGPAEPHAVVGTDFTYQGYLEDNGVPANGEYDFWIRLYDAASAGNPVGSITDLGDVDVVDGYFTVQVNVGFDPNGYFNDQALWLEICVRPGASSGSYTTLTPRQPLTAVPYAFSLVPGATMDAEYNYTGHGIINAFNRSTGSSTNGVQGTSYSTIGGSGLAGYNYSTTGSGYGVFGIAAGELGTGVRGEAISSTGVNYGVYGKAKGSYGYGVYGEAPIVGVYGLATAATDNNYGVYGMTSSTAGVGVFGNAPVTSGSASGVYGQTTSTDGRGVVGWAISDTGATRGVYGRADSASGYAGYFYNNSTGVALRAESETTTGDVLRVYGTTSTDIEFRVTGNGNVFADGTFTPGGADLAEMLPAVEGLQAGEVLVIGPDGKLTRSTQAYQASVVGVYSTQPGFLGGAGDDTGLTGKVPLAVIGVVSVKVSAENGDIQPGDLLVASATPGHAMRTGANPPVGTVIGKALGALNSGTGVILVLVMLQ